MQPFDLNSENVNRPLAETIAWCTRHRISKLPATDDIRKHLNRLEEASKLMHEAYKERHRLWNRLLHLDYQESRKYRLGVTLLQDDAQSSFSISTQLRSVPLKPELSLNEVHTEQQKESVVRSLIQRRAEFLHAMEITGVPAGVPGVAGGRLLLYWPAENVSDGASEQATRGFFDVDDAPPWDTWVTYSQGTLLSWVPAQLLDLVKAGIDANAVGCIQWLD